MFDDNLFEMSEQFSVQYTGIVLPDSTATPSVPGVMVQPSTATVLILDNDGKMFTCSSSVSPQLYAEHQLTFDKDIV